MNKAGLVSISFRQNSVEEIVNAVKKTCLSAVEWGGDVHCPHGDIERARYIKSVCDEAEIEIPEYGSYYTVGASEPELFDKVLVSAEILGAKRIRIWGYNKSSDQISNEEYNAVTADAKRISILAKAKNITLCLECHPHTVTDEYHHAIQFINDVNEPNLQMFWQPNQFRNLEYNIDSIRALKPYINSVHVYSWVREAKYPLNELESNWKAYINELADKDIFYMLEFMHDGKIESLENTAKTLKGWLNK